MANPERGEVEVVVNGKPYTLKLSMNAAVAIEKRTGKEVGELLAAAGRVQFAAMRHIMWLLLQKYHAAQFTDEEAVGDWIDDAGGPVVFMQTLATVAGVNRDETEAAPTAAANGGAHPSAAHAH